METPKLQSVHYVAAPFQALCTCPFSVHSNRGGGYYHHRSFKMRGRVVRSAHAADGGRVKRWWAGIWTWQPGSRGTLLTTIHYSRVFFKKNVNLTGVNNSVPFIFQHNLKLYNLSLYSHHICKNYCAKKQIYLSFLFFISRRTNRTADYWVHCLLCFRCSGENLLS